MPLLRGTLPDQHRGMCCPALLNERRTMRRGSRRIFLLDIVNVEAGFGLHQHCLFEALFACMFILYDTPFGTFVHIVFIVRLPMS